MSAAAFLAPPARPPHDPLWMRLGGAGGWPTPALASSVEVEPCSGALALTPVAAAFRSLAEPSGSLGGLVLPKWTARDCEVVLWLLSQTTGELLRFDDCTCAFVTVPCTAGIGPGARQLLSPGGVAVTEDRLYLCDRSAGGRVLVFDRRAFALRTVLVPPTGATAQPWTPVAAAFDRGVLHVADPANGGIHRFAAWGGWLGMSGGLGAVDALAFDAAHRLFAVDSGSGKVFIGAPHGGSWAEAIGQPVEYAGCFAPMDDVVGANGLVDLSARCPELAGQGFGPDGLVYPLPPPPDAAFVSSGTWIAGPLDSRIAQCVWHRVTLDAIVAAHQHARLSAYTAEVELGATDVALLPPSSWSAIPPAVPGEDALIMAPPGRYLWLRIELDGDGSDSPRLCGATLEYPRISLRRYLPAAFGANPEAADFTDRLLAIFDTGFRAYETRIDDGAMLFDADSAPAEPGRDILGWLAAWLGLALERGWPVARRRKLVGSAARLFACRGTLRGLREAVLLWLDWSLPITAARPPACGPRCRPAARAPEFPQLVLEHWKLRRWLWLGKGRLGSDAVVWGESILGRSRLGETAQTGATRLDSTRNPLADPFNAAANRFSLFLPARHIETPVQRAQFDRLVADQSPADAMPSIVPVHARMRVGIQACIGFDSVVGCWPQGITLDTARLGRGTVLSGGGAGRPPRRIGRTARLQPAQRPRPSQERESRA